MIHAAETAWLYDVRINPSTITLHYCELRPFHSEVHNSKLVPILWMATWRWKSTLLSSTGNCSISTWISVKRGDWCIKSCPTPLIQILGSRKKRKIWSTFRFLKLANQNSNWLRTGRPDLNFQQLYGFFFSQPHPNRLQGPSNTNLTFNAYGGLFP